MIYCVKYSFLSSFLFILKEMYSIEGHIIRLLYLCPFHFFFTVLILLNILYSYLLSGKIKKYKYKYNAKPAAYSNNNTMYFNSLSSMASVQLICIVAELLHQRQVEPYTLENFVTHQSEKFWLSRDCPYVQMYVSLYECPYIRDKR